MFVCMDVMACVYVCVDIVRKKFFDASKHEGLIAYLTCRTTFEIRTPESRRACRAIYMLLLCCGISVRKWRARQIKQLIAHKASFMAAILSTIVG